MQHGNSPLHIHSDESSKPGVYHIGVIVEGRYYPSGKQQDSGHSNHDVSGGHGHSTEKGSFEQFTRVLHMSFGVV